MSWIATINMIVKNHTGTFIHKAQLLAFGTLCLAFLREAATAQELLIERQITGIAHTYEPPDEFMGMPGQVTNEILFDTSGLNNIDLDQYVQLTLRLRPAAGQRIYISGPVTHQLQVEVTYSTGVGDTASNFRSGWGGFENYVGTLPERTYSLFYISNSANRLNFAANEQFQAGSSSFTGMYYAFYAPSGLSTSPKSFSLSTNYKPIRFTYQTYSTTDPGPFVFLGGAEIKVEQPSGTPLIDGSSSVSFGATAVGYNSSQKIFTVKNTGGVDLTISDISIGSPHAGDFTLNDIDMATTIASNADTTFSVTFNSSSPGLRSSTLQITSNDLERGVFDIPLSGTGLSFDADTDGDAMSDAAEHLWASLGFDWQTSQPSLVQSFMTDANRAGLFTAQQVKALHIGTPLIQRNPSGQFTLTMGLEKSTSLQQGSFRPLSFGNGTMSVNNEGKCEFLFSSEDDAAFFRLETGEPNGN